MSTLCPISTFSRYTRSHVPEAYSSHCHEAEVEGVEEAPVLPDDEHRGSEEIEENHSCQTSDNHQEVSLQTDWLR